MPVTNIPDEHHVVRHCKKRQTIRENGVAVGIYPDAFLLRPANPPQRLTPEEYLSAIYYEHFVGSSIARMKSCCEALAFAPKARDAMIRMNVGRVKECFRKRSLGIRVTHEPKAHNPSYAAIRPQKIDAALAGVLATESIVELVEVCDI